MANEKHFGDPLRSLRNRNFRIYSFGIFVSLLGTFLQLQVFRTLGYELSNQSAAVLGLITACASMPGIVLFLIGNIVAGAFERRRILMVMAFLAALPPLWLCYLSANGQLTAGNLVIASLFLGVLIPFENPARYPLIANTVHQSEIGNAFAFSQWMVYLGKASGPLLGAVSLSLFGPAWCFAINATTYGCEFVSLLFVSDCKPSSRVNLATFFALPRFLFRQENRTVCLLVMLVSLIGVQVQLSPIMAISVLGLKGGAVAALITAAEIGTIMGGFLVASIYKFEWVIKPGAFAMGLCVVALSLSNSLPASIAAMVAAGFCQGIVLSSSQSLLQSRVTENLRGVLGSTYFTCFFVLQGLGALILACLADRFGFQGVFFCAGSLLLGASCLATFLRAR